MDLAKQEISTDKIVKTDTIEESKDFNSQSLTTQAKTRKYLVSMMPAVEKAFNLLGDDIVELHTENESLKNKTGSYDGICLEESKTKLLKQFDDEKKQIYLCLG